MANQRKKGKKRLNFWLTEDECGELKKYADFRGINRTDAMRELLIMAADRIREKEGKKSARRG